MYLSEFVKAIITTEAREAGVPLKDCQKCEMEGVVTIHCQDCDKYVCSACDGPDCYRCGNTICPICPQHTDLAGHNYCRVCFAEHEEEIQQLLQRAGTLSLPDMDDRPEWPQAAIGA